jgi:hypothetical protein
VATSGDGGQTFTNLNDSIGTALFYGVDFGRGSAASNARIYAGTQDNGVIVRLPSEAGLDWTVARSGDGGPAAADPNDPERAYSSLVGLSPVTILVTNDGGVSWVTPGGVAAAPEEEADSPAPPADPGPVNSFPRIAVDASSGSPGRPSAVLYVSEGAALLQAVNANAASPQEIRLTRIRDFATPIMALAVQGQAVWAGLRDGSVWRTADGRSGASAAWTQVTITGRPSLPVGALAIDGRRAAVGYFSAGIGPLNPAQHVFLTGDGGASWRDVSAGVPDLTINAVLLEAGLGQHTIVVATQAGVLRSLDEGATWAPLGTGLPAVDVTSLAFDPATSVILMGTYGRGAYELDLRAPTRIPTSTPGPIGSEQPSPVTVVAAVVGTATALALLLVVIRLRRRT